MTGLWHFGSLFMLWSASMLSALADDSAPQTVDPFTDPKHDINNPLRYIPSNVLSGISVGLFFAVSTILGLLMWKSRYPAKYLLTLIIGGYCMTFGLAMRFALTKKPDSSGLYIVEYLFVVLSPCAFIAADYVLLGRLARHLNVGKHLFVRPDRVTKIFVTSDVTTFLIQAAGGGLSTSHQITTAEAGSHIFLAGLALQLASFFFFSCLYVVFMFKVWKREPEVWKEDRVKGKKWWEDWRALAAALTLSCIGILIRSVYRTIELSQGYHGALATNEATFYGLDTLPLFIAVSIYILFWPGRFIDPARVKLGTEVIRNVETGDIPSADRPSSLAEKERSAETVL